MRVFITGVLGFVARHVVNELAGRGCGISGIDVLAGELKKQRLAELPGTVEILPCDLSRVDDLESALRKISPDWVLHLAAQSSASRSFEDPHGTLVANVVGSLNLLEALRKTGFNGKALFVGSSEVYGNRKERVPAAEDARFSPTSPYAASKAAQDLIAEQYGFSFELGVIRTRSFGHTGQGQTTTFAIPSFAEQLALIAEGRRQPVLEVGNLDVVRDYTDVRDVARAYVLLLEKGRTGEAYNVCSGQGRSMRDVLNRMIELSGTKVELKAHPARIRKSDIEYLVGDNAKIRKETSWLPAIGMDETLSSVLEYWRERARKTGNSGKG